MDPLDIFSGIWDFGSKLFQTGYNLYTNKRDFDYQKELQKQIFEREDTAVQRRMNDLKAAGLNPNLAAGSSAGAGAVVGRSNTNDIGVGSALDTIAAINQIKLQRKEQEIKDKEYELASYQTARYQQDWALENAIRNYKLGFNPRVSFGKDGKLHVEAQIRQNEFSDSKYAKELDENLKYLTNSNQYLQKELNWYNANQIVDMLTGGIGAVTGIVNSGANIKRANSMLRR